MRVREGIAAAGALCYDGGMKRKLLLAALLGLSAAAPAAADRADLDPLSMRWTFGAHEPYTMYRRVGRHCTGGIDGNAKWVKPWLDWWDAEAPALMEELGFNWLHGRFYKGMGWEEEKKDFPNVRKFVRNCHAHGVHALAYVQFSTLYPEPMKREVPGLEDWAQVGPTGERNTYYGQYFRWMPCVTCDDWVAYVKRMCTIALAEGGFDGVMFDNVFSFACYCPRCERAFRDYVQAIPDKAARFGFDDLSHVVQPRGVPRSGEVRDPVQQAWYRWRTERMARVLGELRAHIKSVKPDAVVSGNPHPYRYAPDELARERGLDMYAMDRAFDLIIMQSDNFPEVTKEGMVINRVRDLKMAQARGKVLVALCDSDAKVTEARERNYLLPLMEDAMFGGVPTDRTIVSPRRVPGFVDRGVVARRRPQLAKFNALLADRRAAFAAPTHGPVKLFVPSSALMFSPAAHLALAAAEEILLRNRVPWNYAVSRADEAFRAPADCEVLVLPGTSCLSDAEIGGVLAYARKGGRLVVTGEAGRYDEWNAERFTSPLMDELKAHPDLYPGAVLRAAPDALPSARLGWVSRVAAPADGGAALAADLARTGWRAPVQVVGAPPHVFAEYKRTAKGYAVHLLNYDPSVPVSGARLVAPGAARATFTEPFGAEPGARPVADGALPDFSQYALVEVELGGAGAPSAPAGH